MNTTIIGFPVLFCGQQTRPSEHKRNIFPYRPWPWHDLECAPLRISVAGQPQRKQEQKDGLGAVLPAVFFVQWWGQNKSNFAGTAKVTCPFQVPVTDGYKLVDTAEFWRPWGKKCCSSVLAVTYHYYPLHIIETQHFVGPRMNTSPVWGLKTTNTTLNESLFPFYCNSTPGLFMPLQHTQNWLVVWSLEYFFQISGMSSS